MKSLKKHFSRGHTQWKTWASNVGHLTPKPMLYINSLFDPLPLNNNNNNNKILIKEAVVFGALPQDKLPTGKAWWSSENEL